MPLRCGAGAFLRLFEKHSFSNSLSIETTLSIEIPINRNTRRAAGVFVFR